MRHLTKIIAVCLQTVNLLADAPVIHIEQRSLDFGAAYDDRPIEHCFVIENRGDAPLSIHRVAADCGGCLSYLLETNTIAPGKSAVVELILDAQTVEGDVEKHLVLHTNDPETPILPLTICGTVVPKYRVRPKSVFFASACTGTVCTQVVRITGPPESAMRLSNLSVVGNHFEGVLHESSVAGVYELEVRTVPPVPEGVSCAEMVATSSNPAAPKCIVRVTAYVPPVFNVLPDRLLFKPVDLEQLRIVFVRQNSRNPVVVREVLAPSHEFVCEINPGPGDADYRIMVRAAKLAGRTGMAGSLVIKTDSSSRREIVIPIEIR